MNLTFSSDKTICLHCYRRYTLTKLSNLTTMAGQQTLSAVSSQVIKDEDRTHRNILNLMSDCQTLQARNTNTNVSAHTGTNTIYSYVNYYYKIKRIYIHYPRSKYSTHNI